MAFKPIKVSQLNSYIKRILQSDPILGNVSVVGEISNLKFHGSGHVYFTMKDENSKLNCFLAADNLKHIRYELADGMQITAAGYVYVYEKGGSYSLNVRDISVEGLGNLSAAFEKLKKKLSDEGLFEEQYKKPLPFFPKKVAVITSETGAAVRDIIKIIRGRNNIVDVLVYPCLVQGPAAAGEISEAIDGVNRLFPETDVIICGRGGGSMEELWAFNEEIVARSIFSSKIPVISAVGHETDFTIADFVADRRAETPTAAAQLAVPDTTALREYLSHSRIALTEALTRYLQYAELRIRACSRDSLKLMLTSCVRREEARLESCCEAMRRRMSDRLNSHERDTERLKAELEALSPRNIMKRGYGAILDQNGALAGSAGAFRKGDPLTAVLADGAVHCTVETVEEEEA